MKTVDPTGSPLPEATTPPRVKAAQYLRASSEHQRYSVQAQRAAIALYALEHGYEIVGTYVDDGRSGVTITKRDGLKQLLAEVLAGEAPFAVVLVLDVSRWGRFQNPDQAAHYEFICREAGVRVRYCAEAFENDDSTTASLMKGIKRVMAGEYSRELSTKVRRAKRQKVELGFVPGGVCPFGVARQEHLPGGSMGRVLKRGERKGRPEYGLRYVHGDPAEIAVIERIFHLYLRRRMYPAEIARALQAEGLCWIGGVPFTFQHIRRVLICELLTGVLRFQKESTALGGARTKHPPSEWGAVRVMDSIISPKTFEAARRRQRWVADHRRLSDEKMLADLRRVKARAGRLSTAIVNRAVGCSNASYYDKRFGSLGRALELIGEPARVNRQGGLLGHKIPDSELVAALQRLEREAGSVCASLILKTPWMPSYMTYTKRYGSIVAACKVAGVKVGGQRRTDLE